MLAASMRTVDHDSKKRRSSWSPLDTSSTPPKTTSICVSSVTSPSTVTRSTTTCVRIGSVISSPLAASDRATTWARVARWG